MIPTEQLQELSFDLYERYILLERIEKLFQPPESPYRVLDVGGHTPAFWPGFSSLAGVLIPHAHVTVVDVLPHAELRNYIRGSGLQLPFRDQSFDLVCSLDTLEHIPAEDRPALLAELIRVTRDGLYVAFPFDSPSNRWAESVIVEYADVVLKDPIAALEEHRQFGLPDRNPVSSFLSGTPYPLIHFEQGNTDVWLLMMLTYHTLRKAGTDFVHELNRRFNQVYAAQDWAPPAYRTGYVLSKRRSRQELETLQASFGGADAGKRADLQAVLAFCQLFLNIGQSGRVLLDKDRHIRNIEGELAAGQETLRTAELENSELRGSLSLLSRQSADLSKQIADLQQRVVDAQQQVVDAQQQTADAQQQTADLQAQIADFAEQTADFEKQIAKVKSAVEAHAQRSAQMSSANLESLARVYDRMKEIEMGLLTDQRDIQAIYDSRIWKTLRGMGGALLRWSWR